MDKTILVLCTMCIFSMSSCTNENITPVSTPDEMVNLVQDGIWKITYFNDSGDDETAYFSDYTFTFGNNGTLIASNDTNLYNGSWSVTDSHSSDDSPDDMHFNIHFNLSNNFEELNDDWHILSHSDSKIELIDISGGNGGTDFLTFEVN